MKAIKTPRLSRKLTRENYDFINLKYFQFRIVYKYIHGETIKYPINIDIDFAINSVYAVIFGNKGNKISKENKIKELKKLSKDEYDRLFFINSKELVQLHGLDIGDYFQINQSVSAILENYIDKKQIVNLEVAKQIAFSTYRVLDNVDELVESVIEQTNVMITKIRQNKRQKNQLLSPLANIYYTGSKQEKISTKSSDSTYNQEVDQRIELNKNRQKIIEQLGEIGELFTNELDTLIKLSIQGNQNDDRYKYFHGATANIYNAIEYIKLFIHENKTQDQGNHLEYFTYNEPGESKPVINNSLLSMHNKCIGNYFIKKVILAEKLEREKTTEEY